MPARAGRSAAEYVHRFSTSVHLQAPEAVAGPRGALPARELGTFASFPHPEREGGGARSGLSGKGPRAERSAPARGFPIKFSSQNASETRWNGILLNVISCYVDYHSLFFEKELENLIGMP